MNIQDYVKPELLILVPVLYIIGLGVKKSETIKDKYIPMILGACGVVLASIWVCATCSFAGMQDVLLAVFTGVVQGILVAGASVLTNQVVKQSKKED